MILPTATPDTGKFINQKLTADSLAPAIGNLTINTSAIAILTGRGPRCNKTAIR